MKPPKQHDLREEIRELRARIAKLEAGSQLGDSAITRKQTTVRGGKVSVQNEDGVAVAELGGVYAGRAGWVFNRDNGTVVFECVDRTNDGVLFRQGWVLYNSQPQAGFGGSAEELVAEDTVTGINLARPYSAAHMGRARYTDWPACTSGSYEDIWYGSVYRIGAVLVVTVGCTSDTSGTEGNVRVMVDGVQLGDTQNIGFAIGFNPVAAAWPVGHNHTQHAVTVQARRTAGTGAIRCEVLSVWQTQS